MNNIILCEKDSMAVDGFRRCPRPAQCILLHQHQLLCTRPVTLSEESRQRRDDESKGLHPSTPLLRRIAQDDSDFFINSYFTSINFLIAVNLCPLLSVAVIL
jgi:hypothetical protein